MKRIVLIAGRKSHGPDHNGIHDYPAQVRLLAWCLRHALGGQVDLTLAYDDAWPREAIAKADALVVISDGKDGDKPYAKASQLADAGRIADVEALCARGGGVACLHFALFAGEADGERMDRWCGAHFAWEQHGQRDWHSKITWAEGVLDRGAAHPVLNGFRGASLREEYYHRLRFHTDTIPLVIQRALPGTGSEQVVAWCVDHGGKGRGFGTTMGHSLDSFRHDGLRTLTLNGIAWCAGIDLPEGGLQAPFAEREAVARDLDGAAEPGPIRVAVLAGNAAHRWHNWPESTAALLRAWGDDERITARVHTDPGDLVEGLADRDVLVLNWVNWEDPRGLSAAAQDALTAFLARGGGLFVHHFANGACHASLPRAGASDWPEYRRIVRRVWDHRDVGPGPSGHDRHGTFAVQADGQHPLTAGLGRFEVEDELYWRQHGDEPIVPLLRAKSAVTGADEPLLWTYDLGPARAVQCLLGHSGKTYATAQMRVLARRIVAWCARRDLHGASTGP